MAELAKPLALRFALSCVFMLAGVALSSQQGQQKGVDASGRVFWPPVPVPGVKRSEITAVPRDAMVGGNCRVGGRGYSLLLSQDPAFQAVIGDDLRSEYVVGGFTPEQRKAWLERIKRFVPIFLKGLESDNPCVQLDSMSYLGLIQDPGAVEPLLKFIEEYPADSEVVISAMRHLAITYREKRVVPFMVGVIEQGRLGTDLFNRTIQACVDGLRDERLFEALLHLFEGSKDHLYDKGVLSALYHQADDGRHKQQMTDLYRRHIGDPAFASSALALAPLIASPETFDEIAALYEHVCQDHTANCWGLYDVLRQIGGPKFLAFSRCQAFATQNPCEMNKNKAVILEDLQKRIPASFPPGQDLVGWLQQNAGDLIDWFDLSGLLLRDPNSKPDASPERRAAYWERAAKLFERNKPVLSWIGLQLYKAYGPEGLDDPEKALRAITMALDDYSSPGGGKPGEWQQYKSNLERRLRSDRIRAVLRIEAIAPSEPGDVLGAWKGILILPEDAVRETLANRPFAYLDFIDSTGKEVPVVAEVQFEEQISGVPPRLPFSVVPQDRPKGLSEAIVGIRLRLLFLPRAEGFSGTIISPLVTVR